MQDVLRGLLHTFEYIAYWFINTMCFDIIFFIKLAKKEARYVTLTHFDRV